MECSHYYTRGKWAVRFDPANASSACTACHFRVGGGRERLADEVKMDLDGKVADQALGRAMKRTKGKGAIAKHFRGEYARMRALRASGEVGRIEFNNFPLN